MDVMDSIQTAPAGKTAVKYFDGTQWTQCDYDDLRRDVKSVSGLILDLRGKSGIIGFYVVPFLGLPALVCGAAVSSCPFTFISDEKFSSPHCSSLLRKLRVHWIMSDHLLDVQPHLVLLKDFTLCGTVLHVYKNHGVTDRGEEAENYLYGITTSGSTGEPKVVRVPKESLWPNIRDFSAEMNLTSDDVILQSSALTFDPSMIELFLAVLNRATLILVSQNVKRNPQMFHEAIAQGKVTFYQTTPSLFRLWPADLKLRLLGVESSLKDLVLGGEPFPRMKELRTWDPGPKINIFNTYGITEVSCWATLKLVWPFLDERSSSDEVDIGHVLSETVLEVKEDETTEFHHLLIGGATRTCAIEDESFEELFSSKAVFRPTGDIFKIKDGKFFFSHRKDSSIKRLGKKILMSRVEEEAKCLGLECVLVVKPGEQNDHVILFIVGDGSSHSLIKRVCTLKNLVPSDHWPDEITYVKELPISDHGKVDKAKLMDYVLPRSNQPKRASFEESWNHFTFGHRAALDDSDRKKGFITSGGNSFNAVLFLNSLEDRGFAVHPNLLVAMLKDEKFDDCLALFLNESWFNGSIYQLQAFAADQNMERPLLKELDQQTENRPLPAPTNSAPLMALKGQSWPESFPVDPVWSQDIQGIDIEWSKDLLKCVDASPLGVVTDRKGLEGFAVVGSHSGLVLVVELVSGKVLSRTQLPDRVEASACLSSDFESYYIGCYDGRVYRIDIAGGSIIWNFPTDDMVKATCCLHESKIFVGSYDKHVYAITEGGDLKWRRNIGPVTIPAVALSSRVFFGTLTGRVFVLMADSGAVVCDCKIGPPLFANMLLVPHSTGTCLLTAPVQGMLQWRDTTTLEQVHGCRMDGTMFAAPVLRDSSVLVASGNTLTSLRAPTRLWSRTFDDRIVSTPFVVANRIVVISIDGQLSILDVHEGHVLRTFRFPGEVFSSPIVVGSRVYVGCRDNNFYCVKVGEASLLLNPWFREVGSRVYVGCRDNNFYYVKVMNCGQGTRIELICCLLKEL